MVRIWRVYFGENFTSHDVTGEDIHEAIDSATTILMNGMSKKDKKVLEENGELEIHKVELVAESDN